MPHSRRLLLLALVSSIALIATVLMYASAPVPGQASHMQEHFSKIIEIQQAVIRGDLDDVRAPARWFAEHEEGAGLPAYAQRFVGEMRKAATRAAEAKDLQEAAAAAGALVAACGTCHTAVGYRPALPPPSQPAVAGGTVGHMLAHQQAVDLLEAGLIVPSDSRWNEGAGALKQAPLARNQLPRDPALTNEIAAVETQVHRLADEAAKTKDAAGRGAIYGQLIGGCGQCHALHGRVWGPGIPKQ